MRISLEFVYERAHLPCWLQALGLPAGNTVADVTASWAPYGKFSIGDIQQG